MTDFSLQIGIALIMISGLIVMMGLAAKKRQGRESLMKVMGYQSLGPKKGLAMVRVGEEVILVGVTATDVKLLKTLGPAAQQVEPNEETAATPAESGRAVIADAAGNLDRLRALKDRLVCN